MYRGWQRDATTNERQLERWFADETRNVGVVAGETFDAFDIEADHLDAFYARMLASGGLRLTPVAITGRGGLHILTAPTGTGGTRRLYLDGVHIGELKSIGGFIAVCPSVTVGQYRWRLAPAGMTVAAAPDWLLGLIAPRPDFAEAPIRRLSSTGEMLRTLNVLAHAVLKTPKGNRNNVLFWAAMRALEEGVGTAEDIDAGAKIGLNHPMGPLQLADFIGLDVCRGIMEVLHEGFGQEHFRPPRVLVDLVEAGHLGQKTGRGFHAYPRR